MLTAIEDFVAQRDDVRLVIVPAFFGFGVVWHNGARVGGRRRPDPRAVGSQSPARAAGGQPRAHLARSHVRFVEATRAQQRSARQEVVLRRLLESSAFSIAERLSRLRERVGIATDQSVVSKDEIRRALAD